MAVLAYRFTSLVVWMRGESRFSARNTPFARFAVSDAGIHFKFVALTRLNTWHLSLPKSLLVEMSDITSVKLEKHMGMLGTQLEVKFPTFALEMSLSPWVARELNAHGKSVWVRESAVK